MGLYCVFVFILGKEKEHIEAHSHAVDDGNQDHNTNTDNEANNDGDRCKVEVSRCLSSILESGEKPLESSGTALWRYNLFVRTQQLNQSTDQPIKIIYTSSLSLLLEPFKILVFIKVGRLSLRNRLETVFSLGRGGGKFVGLR